MLFTCHICKFGHSVMNVEAFHCSNNGKRSAQVYLCKDHLHERKDDWIHVPWLDEPGGLCPVCQDFGSSSLCYGKKNQPDIIIYGTGKNFAIENKKTSRVNAVLNG